MITTTPYFTVTGTLPMSMFLQKNQPKPICPSLQMATEFAAEEKKNATTTKKVGKAIGDPVSGRDAPIRYRTKTIYIGTFVLQFRGRIYTKCDLIFLY